MPLSDRVKHGKEGQRSPIDMALMIQKVADAEVGKVTGAPEAAGTPKPRVWILVSQEMLQKQSMTGEEGFAGASEETRAFLRSLLPEIEAYLAYPHIIDSFATHIDRDNWAEQYLKPLGRDVFRYFKKNKLHLQSMLKLQKALTDLAEMTKELKCPEAIYLREVISKIGSKKGLPDVITTYRGIDDSDKEPLGKMTEDDKAALLEILNAMKGGAPSKANKDTVGNYLKYDALSPDKKWEQASRYQKVCHTLLKKIRESDKKVTEAEDSK